MNIKDFLIENYIWILVVILLTIVTIIGFLADKKKSGKKEKNEANNIQPMNQPQMAQPIVAGPINYQPMENNTEQQMVQPTNGSLNFQLPPNTNIQPVNQMVNSQVNQMPTNQMNIQPPVQNTQVQTPSPFPQVQMVEPVMNNVPQDTFRMNNPTPVEPIAPVTEVSQEPMYQPLSEQTPHFNPRDINTEISIPTPVPVVTEEVPQINQMQPSFSGESVVEPMNQNMEYPNPQPQPVAVNPQQVQMMQPNMNFNNMVQQPENNVIPQPIPIHGTNNTIPSPTNGQVMQQPMNFVYGPNQNGNNQNMM